LSASSFGAPQGAHRRLVARLSLTVISLVGLAACDPAASPSATSLATSAAEVPRASSSVIAPAITPGPIRPPGVPVNAQPLLFGCTDGLARCTDIAPGTYYTAGEWAFLPGLTFTLPAGWTSVANEAGELELHRTIDDHNEILVWRDVVPWQDGRAADLALDPDAWIARLTADRCLEVTDPETVVLGKWIDLRPDRGEALLEAIGVSVARSSDVAAYQAAGCPETRIVEILVDPVHWENSPFSVGGDEMNDSSCPCSAVQRLYFASIGYPVHRHLLVVALQSYGPNGSRDAEMASLESAAQPILDSLIAPAIVVDN